MAPLRRRGPVQRAPVGRPHQFGPAAVKLAVVALAERGVAGPAAEGRVECLAPQAHLVVDRHLAGHDAAAGLGAFLPVVHVVLLERAGRAETAHPRQAERLLDLARRRLVDEYPGPHLGLLRAARLPQAERARSAAQQREIREYRADDRVGPVDAGSEAAVDL